MCEYFSKEFTFIAFFMGEQGGGTSKYLDFLRPRAARMLLLRLRIWCVLIAAVTTQAFFPSSPAPYLFCSSPSTVRGQQWRGKGIVYYRRSNNESLLFSGERARTRNTPPRSTSDLTMAATSAALSASRRLGKLGTSSTIFFACDIQERFRNVIHNMPAVISTARYDGSHPS